MAIFVVGSLNMDFVLQVDRAPVGGETIRGKEMTFSCGGKGANQAAALGKFGNEVFMVGKIGEDAFGSELIDSLNAVNVNTEQVFRESETSTGIAFIVVENNGENRIILSPGANSRLTTQDVEVGLKKFSKGDILILQSEIAISVVEHAIHYVSPKKGHIVFNAAPFTPVDLDVLRKVEYLIINEIEAAGLSGLESISLENVSEACSYFKAIGLSNVIITLGKEGAYFYSSGQEGLEMGFQVDVVDTTGAGDVFVAGFTHGLINEYGIRQAVRLGNAAGALTCTITGAQNSIPDLKEVMILLNQ